jgi:hypothetical protein
MIRCRPLPAALTVERGNPRSSRKSIDRPGWQVRRGTTTATRGFRLQGIAFTVTGRAVRDDGVDDDRPTEEDQ